MEERRSKHRQQCVLKRRLKTNGAATKRWNRRADFVARPAAYTACEECMIKRVSSGRTWSHKTAWSRSCGGEQHAHLQQHGFHISHSPKRAYGRMACGHALPTASVIAFASANGKTSVLSEQGFLQAARANKRPDTSRQAAKNAGKKCSDANLWRVQMLDA